MLFMLGQPEVEWVLGNVQRESDRWERGWPSEEMAAAVVGLAGGMRLSLESETPAAPGLEAHTHLIVGTDGLLIVSQDGRGSDYAVRIVGRDGRTRDIPASGDYYDDARLRETDALAAWAAGDLDEHRGDAHLAIKTQEALMAIYESARTRTLVRLPLKTMASPLIQMIESGELPVRYHRPLRHPPPPRATGPDAPALAAARNSKPWLPRRTVVRSDASSTTSPAAATASASSSGVSDSR